MTGSGSTLCDRGLVCVVAPLATLQKCASSEIRPGHCFDKVVLQSHRLCCAGSSRGCLDLAEEAYWPRVATHIPGALNIAAVALSGAS